MDQWNRPTLSDLFKKEEVVVVKREYRRMFRLNWKIFFRNLYMMISFWQPKHKRFPINAIISSQTKDEVAVLKEHNIEAGLLGRNNMEE